jgi:hypothetical protein
VSFVSSATRRATPPGRAGYDAWTLRQPQSRSCSFFSSLLGLIVFNTTSSLPLLSSTVVGALSTLSTLSTSDPPPQTPSSTFPPPPNPESEAHPGTGLAVAPNPGAVIAPAILTTMKKSLPFTFSKSDDAPRMFNVASLPRAFPMLRGLIPHRVRRKWRATKTRIRNGGYTATSSITKLQTSFDPADTIKALRNHQWTLYDGQYLFLALLGIFCLNIIEFPGPFLKTLVSALILLSLIFPITRQFFFPCLPMFGWLFLFYGCK